MLYSFKSAIFLAEDDRVPTILMSIMVDKNVLLAIDKGQIRDELLLDFGHAGMSVLVSINDAEIKDILRSKSVNCLIMQMNFKSFDALEILLDMKDAGIDVPVILVNFSSQYADIDQLDAITQLYICPPESKKVFETANELLNLAMARV